MGLSLPMLSSDLRKMVSFKSSRFFFFLTWQKSELPSPLGALNDITWRSGARYAWSSLCARVCPTQRKSGDGQGDR